MANSMISGCLLQAPLCIDNNEKLSCRRPLTRCSNNGSQRKIASVKRSPKVVFQDDMKGIVCYKNENGEVICEGLDEGPHFHPHIAKQQQTPAKFYSILHMSHIRPYLVEGLDFKCLDEENG